MNLPNIIAARLSKDEVKEVYNRLSWMYDQWGAFTETRAKRRRIELAAVQDGESLLDVATVPGGMWAWIFPLAC